MMASNVKIMFGQSCGYYPDPDPNLKNVSKSLKLLYFSTQIFLNIYHLKQFDIILIFYNK